MASPCDCGNPLDYRQCCKPLHRGEAFAQTPGRLVQARFCAFARKEVDFLLKTRLAVPGEDLAQTRIGIRDACIRFRYARLHLLAERGDQVLFVAEVYERGKECSFVERSSFARNAEGQWTYVDGSNRPCRVAELSTLNWENGP